MNPESSAHERLLSLFGAVNRLKSLPRMGWLLAGVAGPESVADHVSGVGLMSLFLAEEINQDLRAQGLTHRLDVGKVTALALIHDLAESVLTDLPKSATDALGKAVKHRAESGIVTELLGEFAWGGPYISLWAEYDAAASAEARLVKDVDKLEMVLQAKAYARRGHEDLDEFWQGHTWYFPLVKSIVEMIVGEPQGSRQTDV